MADRQADAMQFVVAIAKVEQIAAALLGRDHDAVRRFRDAEPGVRPIRNVLEHVDDYLTGRGHLQRGVLSGDPFRVGFRSDDNSMILSVGDMEIQVAEVFEASMRLFRVAQGGVEYDDE